MGPMGKRSIPGIKLATHAGAPKAKASRSAALKAGANRVRADLTSTMQARKRAFALAMVDALRDILVFEGRRAV